MATIAWIGLGHMGIPMSKNMLKAGYIVRGVDIDPKQAKAAHEAGIQMFDTPAQACAGVDAVFTMVPAGPVRIANLTDAEALEAQLIENLQRRDVHPMEEAQGFKVLLNLEDPKHSIEPIAAKVGKSPVYCAALCG
jgi:ParB-like chromosome segregation protein Spo0J